MNTNTNRLPLRGLVCKWTAISGLALQAIFSLGAATLDREAETVETPPAGQPYPDSAMADLDEDMRFVPTTRPALPSPQHPPQATTQNVDTDKPPVEWQRATDDWLGARPWLDDHGLTFNGSLTIDLGRNVRGGVRTDHGGFGYVLNLNLTLDTDKLIAWPGGTLFVNLQRQDGLENSLDGALQATSHLYAEERTQVSELWFEQSLIDDHVRLRAGKIDANGQFDVPETGEEFLNDGSGFSPTILGFPTDPDPAIGLTAFIYPTRSFYAGAGIFDGSTQAGRPTGGRGLSPVLNGGGGAFLIAELGTTWTLTGDALPGRLAVGVWHHTGEFARFNGSTDAGATGPYLVLDQTIYRPGGADDERGLSAFLACGYADPSISEVTLAASGGLAWRGIIDARPDDVAGLAVDYARLSDQAGGRFDGETVFEGFYKVQALKWMSLKPDIQYILHPANADAHDALAIVLQAIIDL